MADARGKTLDEHIDASLRYVAMAHPGRARVVVHPEVGLLSGSVKRPAYELIYRLEQEHRELIAVQDHDQSSAERIINIRIMKNFSPRIRFVLVFEDFSRLTLDHKQTLEKEGVECLSPAQLDQKLKQLNDVLVAETVCIRPGWSKNPWFRRSPRTHQ